MLDYLEKLGYASVNTDNNTKLYGKLKCEKFMYAAEKGKHFMLVSVPLFALTKSSVNLLRVLFILACSYYTGKTEALTEGGITALGAKAFRLRSDEIQNKSLAS